MTYDTLRTCAPAFYTGIKIARDARKKQPGLDAAGLVLLDMACRAKQIQEAKQHSFYRRTYSSSYLTKSKDGREMYLNDFEDLGPRWVQDANDVASTGHRGWYIDSFENDTAIGVVLCFSRHAAPDENGNPIGRGRQIFMAGMRCSNEDGVILDRDTTDDMVTAAYWADQMAERYAEERREADEAFQKEQRVEELKEEVSLARKACLKLLRDMRPIRKGLTSVPESVLQALKYQVFEYIKTIANYRTQLGELT